MSKTISSNHSNSYAKDASLSDYISLLKPRVMSLVIFTSFIGLYLAPGYIHPVIATVAIVCITLASGASGAINMWYDRDIDAIMTRTQNRPIPKGTIHADEALHLGVSLSLLSVAIMGLLVNVLSAFILAFAIFFYVAIYTMWLKRSTVQNIVIGGAAGALPPLIGWVAVTNTITLEPIILFLIIFIWTPPHFWALALHTSKDYAKAKVPMMPIISGVKSTKVQIFIYTLLLVLTTITPYLLDISGIYYLSFAIVSGSVFLYYSYKMFKDSSYYLKTFKYSILYLFLIFLFLAFDKI
nr:heme o synthase [Alphaproteobacteria bacterium]